MTYSGKNDLIPRQLHSLLYQRVFHHSLSSPSPLPSPFSSSLPGVARPQRIRVGFLSAFFYHHSVGLLLQGVMKHLSRDLFSVIVFFLPPTTSDRVSEVRKGQPVSVAHLSCLRRWSTHVMKPFFSLNSRWISSDRRS
jgi:hypothetical protein